MILNSILWDVSPEIIKIGSLSIRWYGVLFALAFVISWYLMKKIYDKEKVSSLYLEKLALYMFVGVLVGARLGHCLFYEPSYYLANPIEMILPIANGADGWRFIGYQGLASHGAAIGILIAVWLYGRKTNIPFLWTLDRLVIAVCFAGAAIRLGNLMNSEIYGQETSLPWGFIFVRDNQTLAHHPTQLYEALSYITLGFILYFMLLKKQKANNRGFIFGLFLIGLFGARFLIEFLKQNQESWEETMSLNMGQWLSVPFVVAGLILLVLSLQNKFGQGIELEKLKKISKK